MTYYKYYIGQELWRATFESTPACIVCQDCGGTGRIRVLFHDDTMVSIDCQGCSRGYDPPTGRIQVHNRTASARPAIVTGIEIRADKVEYRTTDSYIVPEGDLFPTEPEAVARAAELAGQYDAEERERINQREKPARTWAWNASYHRQCIKRAEKDIAYHTAKLNVASVKAKEAKVGAAP